MVSKTPKYRTIQARRKKAALKKETDPIESSCCGISLFIGILALILAHLKGTLWEGIGYNLGGLFAVTRIVILFLQGRTVDLPESNKNRIIIGRIYETGSLSITGIGSIFSVKSTRKKYSL